MCCKNGTEDTFNFSLSDEKAAIICKLNVEEGTEIGVTFITKNSSNVLEKLQLALECFQNECYEKLALLRNATPTDISYSESSLEEN